MPGGVGGAAARGESPRCALLLGQPVEVEGVLGSKHGEVELAEQALRFICAARPRRFRVAAPVTVMLGRRGR